MRRFFGDGAKGRTLRADNRSFNANRRAQIVSARAWILAF